MPWTIQNLPVGFLGRTAPWTLILLGLAFDLDPFYDPPETRKRVTLLWVFLLLQLVLILASGASGHAPQTPAEPLWVVAVLGGKTAMLGGKTVVLSSMGLPLPFLPIHWLHIVEVWHILSAFLP